jgi:hypothetical protein
MNICDAAAGNPLHERIALLEQPSIKVNERDSDSNPRFQISMKK